MDDSILNELLNNLCEKELKLIKNIFFETEKNYGKRIKEINSNSKFTSSEKLQSYGITIHDNEKMSDIVLRKELLQAFNANIEILENKLLLNENCFFSLGIILHEIGHARDYYFRNPYLPKITDNTQFRFKDGISYYTNYLISEFYAEYFSVNKLLELNSKLKSRDYENSFNDIKIEFNKIKNDYLKTNDLLKLSNSVIEKAHTFILYPFFLKLGSEKAVYEKTNIKTKFLEKHNELVNSLKNDTQETFDLIYILFLDKVRKFGVKIESKTIGDKIEIN